MQAVSIIFTKKANTFQNLKLTHFRILLIVNKRDFLLQFQDDK